MFLSGSSVSLEALMEIPADWQQFLAWLRHATEKAWAHYTPRDFFAVGVGGVDWQPETRWSGGLSDQQIVQVEQKFAVAFPPDYRTFLASLHSTDRPMKGATFADELHLVETLRPGFFDWIKDTVAIKNALAWPRESIMRAISLGKAWPPQWGVRPDRKDERQVIASQRLSMAAPLIPVYGHCYLVASPTEIGKPVLSIYGLDVIIAGTDLRDYFLRCFQSLLGIKMQENPPIGASHIHIATWQDLL